MLPLCPSALSASAKYSGTPAPSAFFFWFSRASASSSASSSEDTSSSSPRPRFGPFICDRGFAAPGTPFAAIFSRNGGGAAFRFSSFFLALRSAAARASSSSRSLGGNGGSLAHMPRCLRGTVLPPRMRRPSSVFWDMRLLFFLALLRWLKSTVMATDRRAMCHGKVGGFRRRLRFDTERARGAGCPSRNWNSGTRARVCCAGRAHRVGRRNRLLGACWSPRGRGWVWSERGDIRLSETPTDDGRERDETIDRDFTTTNARVSDRKRPHVYSSSSSSSRGYGTEACPLQAKPVYPLLRAWMLPTASSLTLKLHVRGCQDDQEENS